MTRSRRSQRGFTMIEVLISVALLASMSALAWAAVSNMFRAQEAFNARTERDLIVRNALARITNEIAAAYLAGPDQGGEQVPGQELDPTQITEEMRVRSNQAPYQFGMIGRRDRIDFTSFGYVRKRDDEAAGHHAEIGYSVRNGRDDQGNFVRQLVRREDTTVDDNLTRGGVSFVLIPEIQSLSISYWDAGEVKVGTAREVAQGRWVNEWDTTRRDYAGRLPHRVRVEITLPPLFEGSSDEVYTTQVQIPITEVLEF
jgi:prepilin-type N-terminal cleavage/methylation domain-containing protein